MKALILGGTKGIGKAIADELSTFCDIEVTDRKIVDTSDIDSVQEFIKHQSEPIDVLVLNTGGPPAKSFFEITLEEWLKYHNQLFLGFCLLLQNLKIADNGYIFLISSFNIKEPNGNLVLSNSYRAASSSILKSLSKEYAKHGISCINIAPGPIKTQRLEGLVEDMEAFEATLPYGKAAEPQELGKFVGVIVKNQIHYLNGVTINFDGGHSNFVF
tara:strand:+ start:2753 stop:3397 length:645 start_codon:yes stop_codon:yes gene_type:complete